MKTKYLFAILLAWLSYAPTFAQKIIKGKVKDPKGSPISHVNINLKDETENIITYTRTNEKGEFNLNISETIKGAKLEATSIGFEKKVIPISSLDKIYEVIMTESETLLNTVVVKNRPALNLKGDTLNFQTSDFAGKEDRTIGDVLKKMPGIEVAENGKISYNGKDISALYNDGDNLMGDKYGIATKAIPHNAIQKVQVIEKDQPIKMLRKNNMSEDIALNLVTSDEAKMKLMGDIKAGLGTPDRFDGNINAIMLKKKLKFINNVKGNNIGIDPGTDLTSFIPNRNQNNSTSNFLSAGAAGVPTLPQRRTLFNKAGLGNFNNLLKFNDIYQVRANLAYLHDQRAQDYTKYSETYLNGQTIKYQENQSNTINPQQFQAKVNITGNADDFYINNTLSTNYSPKNINSSVIINGITANQSLSQKNFDISNEFNFRKKLKSDHTLNFYSYLNHTSQPEKLAINPGINEDVLNNGLPYLGLNQYVKTPSFFTNNYTSFAFVRPSFTQTYRVGISSEHQELNSTLYRIPDSQIPELISSQMSNNLNWWKNKLYTDANYEYNKGNFKATLSLPIDLSLIRYSDPNKNLSTRVNRFFVNPFVSLKYQTGIENYIQANYSSINTIGSMDEIYRGTILTNYRSLYTNDAPLSERKTQNFGANFNFKKAIQMFFFNISTNYSISTLNTISSYTLTNNIQQRVVLPLENDMKAFSINTSFSKYLFDLRSTVNFGVSYSQTSFEQLQNETLLPFVSQTIGYKAGIESKISNNLSWSYTSNYILSKNKTTALIMQNNNRQLRQQSSVTATAFKNLFLTLSAEHIFTHQPNQADLKYLFADLNMRYRLQKLKTDLEFGITNLANVKKFEATFLSANSFTSGTYYIPGRIAMMKATFNF